MNYLKMLKEIDQLLNTKWLLGISDKIQSSEPFTQEEVERMAKMLGAVYTVAHCIHCEVCARSYHYKKER